MTMTDSPNAALHRAQFDSAPLSWVMAEIRDALARSGAALGEAALAADDARTTALRHAKTHLHQAHGALQMVDVDGVGALTAAAEQALERFQDGSLECSAQHGALVADGYQALTDYLEELVSGAAPQPVRLFPYYRALQEMLGAPRIHPADLFDVDLALPFTAPEHAAAAAGAPDYAACRARFEPALLAFMKSAERGAQRSHAQTLQEAIALVAAAQQEPAARTFWLAMRSFAELVADGQLACDLYVKQLFGLINLQIRRLSQGQGSLPPAMLHDALFFIGACAAPGPAAQALRRAFRLEGMPAPDYDHRRYGRIDAAALKTAKEALAHSKAVWNRLAFEIDPQLEADFHTALSTLSGASEQLGAPALAQLLRQIGRAANESIASGRSPEFGLEMATAMLFVEHGLDQVRQLPDDFGGRAEVVGARLLALAAGESAPAAPQWQGDLSRQIQQSEAVAVLATEMKSGLRQVEKVLDDYYAGSTGRATLAQIDPLLHQVQGALAILDQDGAMRAAQHVRQTVGALAAAEGTLAPAADALPAIAQNVGALGFFIDMLARDVDAAKRRFRFDADAGTFRELPFEAAGSEAPTVALPAAPAVVAMPVAVPVAAPVPALPATATASAASDAAVEAELLEIFIGEAQEVLAQVGQTLPLVRAQPAHQETLTILRRCFHTLKGSGRMVGLERFADSGAAIERVMNLWLAEQRAANADLLAMLDHAHAEMSAWVGQLAADGNSPRTGTALVAACGRLLEGGAFVLEPELDEASAAHSAPLVADEAIEMSMPFEGAEVIDMTLPFEADDVAPMEPPVEADDGGAMAPLFEASAVSDMAPPFETVDVSDMTPPFEASDVSDMAPPFEASDVSDMAPPFETADVSAPPFQAEPVRPTAGTSSASGANVIEFPIAPAPVLADDNTRRIGEIEIALPLFSIYLAETDELMRVLAQDFGEWRHEPLRAVTKEALKAVHTLAGTSATVGFKALSEIAGALEAALRMLVAPAPQLAPGQRDLLDTTLEAARKMLQSFAQGELAAPEPSLVAQLHELRTQLASQPAASAYATLDPDLAERLDLLFAATFDELLETAPARAEAQAPLASHIEPGPSVPALRADSSPTLEAAEFEPRLDDRFEAPTPGEAPTRDEADAPLAASPDAHEAIEPALAPGAPPEPGLPARAPALESVAIETLYTDDLDPDLLPVFLEEATDLLPEIGQALRQWQRAPQETAPAQLLLRALHTVKGSARMAGAMRLGQHAHEIETQIENMVHAGTSSMGAFDELIANYDHALLLFEQLQQPAAEAPGAEPAALDAAPQAAVAAPVAQGRAPLVRVRADILDRLVNQAGEVSITRSKLDNQVATLKASLSDFSDNLTRLRRQLREVEMQAESQIASRMSISSEREFDPLEFDRFTRLQELTRMMAESVSDVASFHESLSRTVEAATEDLNVQSRLTRDLQRDLMRVRMVPFSSLSERLFRVARQSAKELDKRVNLDLRGGSVEIDRSVLEQMAAPFEHLLRNAIVHGIEPRATRGAAGKAEIGELLMQVSQQGNEVVIEFSDDGAGLDLERIRAKARSAGLLAPDAAPSDAETAELVFEPGFSTADALTELAGRGVGMDVVRSQAQALGGRVAIASEAGRGARFTIHLPLTLAVTQVVLTTSAGATYALPSILVEQVLQLKEAELTAAHARGTLDYQGQTLALQFLPTLLGERHARPLVQRSSPVLILASGSLRLAVQVDDVLGNREVVIKNIGPQLARMVGISGATVLGSGEIVLILNPVALWHHLEHQPQPAPHPQDDAAPGSATPARDFVVMVVDDSLTVRKVSQRLLEREGYQVMLAKDGVDALEQLQTAIPDLMLVDIEMPRMDGFDLTRNIRGNDSTKAVPIIMITSRSADKHRNYALELGVNAYFGKPFQEDVLLAAVAGLLGRALPVA
jgi:chemosensory pili system protein ChpA (sensor histidine kinase/response regulator)